jgi:hypothetical protein
VSLAPEVGSRIRLVQMDDPDAVPTGTLGTVERVAEFGDGCWQATVTWDNGRTLALIESDQFAVIVPADPFEGIV